jgi:hypothetical protein
MRQLIADRSNTVANDARLFYFFFPMSKVGSHDVTFRLGGAAIILIFSFFGFLASRLPLCWPFAMSISLGLRVAQIEYS